MKGCGKKFNRQNMSELRVCGEHDEHFEDTALCSFCGGKECSAEAMLVFIIQRINVWIERQNSHDRTASIQELRRMESFIEKNIIRDVNVGEGVA